MNKALVILSGGQDSTTCLFYAKNQGFFVEAISFDYSQTHWQEVVCARVICKENNIPHEILNLGAIFSGDSPLINYSKKLDKYAGVEYLPGGLEKTFVPGRNIMFLTMAASYAYNKGIKDIFIGVSQEDFGGYPDCRVPFINSMENSLSLGLDSPTLIHTPLINLSKKDTVKLAQTLPGCMEALAYTHTCYAGTVPPCGSCHACLLREKGFHEAGIKDPLISRLRQEGI